ncbi:ATPase with role in protein import into the ER [Mortierella alpina]|nr:ATPase with role in protein import into the ER [Mortierella alpina]
MRRLGKSSLLSALIALIAVAFLASAIESSAQQDGVPTTLAIEIGSTATRLSVLVGDNGLAFGDTGEPKIILTGPGTHSKPGPFVSNWTAERYLLFNDGTDEEYYVHPFNTLFNLDHPAALRSQYEYDNRPNMTGYQACTLVDITGKYLRELISSAEAIIGHGITFIVIVLPEGQNIRNTAQDIVNEWSQDNYGNFDRAHVPHNYPWTGERVMSEAVGAAERQHKRIYSEQCRRTTAAIFPFDRGMEYSRGVLVYHLGGSTFEVSVHQVQAGSIDTMSSIFNPHLGGNDFNQRIIDYLLLSHKNKTGQDLSSDEVFLLRLERQVEKAKQALSTQDWVHIEIESPYPGDQGLSERLTRSQFETLNMDLFIKTIRAIDQVIKDSAAYTKNDIQDIVFSGGSSNIPFLQSTIRHYFGNRKKYHGLDQPETTVVLGAAKLGHWYQDERHYGGLICCLGESQRTLGIEVAGGVTFKYTDQSSSLDINKMYTFSTVMDNQDRVVVRVFGGDGSRTDQNTFLGEVELTGIAPAPKGVPQIRVRLYTHWCGTSVNLNVMDVASGRVNATIFSTKGLLNDHWFDDDEDEDEENIKFVTLEQNTFELEPAGRLALSTSAT